MTEKLKNSMGYILWREALVSEQELLIAIKRLLSRHPDLISFVFDKHRPKLRCEPEILLQQSGAFCSGEKILIRVALDLWNSSGDARLPDIMERLDEGNFHNVIAALRYLGPKESLSSRNADPIWERFLF
jgi:hypothetical protein